MALMAFRGKPRGARRLGQAQLPREIEQAEGAAR